MGVTQARPIARISCLKPHIRRRSKATGTGSGGPLCCSPSAGDCPSCPSSLQSTLVKAQSFQSLEISHHSPKAADQEFLKFSILKTWNLPCPTCAQSSTHPCKSSSKSLLLASVRAGSGQIRVHQHGCIHADLPAFYEYYRLLLRSVLSKLC